jgi:hypothetical protein
MKYLSGLWKRATIIFSTIDFANFVRSTVTPTCQHSYPTYIFVGCFNAGAMSDSAKLAIHHLPLVSHTKPKHTKPKYLLSLGKCLINSYPSNYQMLQDKKFHQQHSSPPNHHHHNHSSPRPGLRRVSPAQQRPPSTAPTDPPPSRLAS